ncbi:hypothetical protein ACGFX8_35615 [Streptomyces sp. NPDC048362]|uniref:hypothetical protein n=1 Tax=Streptomyces sp. NPDC048362 TaxID=3365539 RepID=UPI003716F039
MSTTLASSVKDGSQESSPGVTDEIMDLRQVVATGAQSRNQEDTIHPLKRG